MLSELASKKYAQIFILLVLVFIVYSPALQNSFLLQWDDGKYIQENPYIKDISFRGIKNIFIHSYFANYHPLTTLSYAFEYRLFKYNPIFYHAFNIILHGLNVILVYFLILKISYRKDAAFIVSVLFSIYPFQVEPVAWISQRKDLLYSFFYLSGLICYINSIFKSEKKYYSVLMYLFFLFSVLSKPTAFTFPLALLVINIYLERKPFIRMILNKIPFVLFSIIVAIIAFSTHTVDKNLSAYISFHSLFNGFFYSCYSFIFYLTEIIFPFRLSALHYFPLIRNSLLPFVFYISPVFILVLCLLIYRFRRFSKIIIPGFLFFIISIIWFLKLIPFGTVMVAERYCYLASLGIFSIEAGLILFLIKKFYRFKYIIISIFILFIVFLSVKTFNRTKLWKNEITLFSDVICKYPDHFKAYVIRGNAKVSNNDLSGAMNDYNHAISLNCKYPKSFFYRAKVKLILKDSLGAISDFTHAVQLDSNYFTAWYYRAYTLHCKKDYSKAIDDYNKAIALKPHNANLYFNVSLAYFCIGDTSIACEKLHKAINFGSLNAKILSDKICIKK